jgi:hypothetical protein
MNRSDWEKERKILLEKYRFSKKNAIEKNVRNTRM